MPIEPAQEREDTMAFTVVDEIPAKSGVRVRQIQKVSKSKPSHVREHPYLPPRGVYATFGKRVLDLTIIALLLPFILPVLAIVWFITALDGGQAIYSQTRVGKGGKIFRCWKIRTMVPKAEAVLQRLIANDPAIAAEWARNQKLAHDPRITRWGRILRKTSIDELPQLFNVVTGDMSLIGPRPFTPEQKDMYDECPNSAAYYHLRPGISGLWQVDCRSSGTFGGRAGYDMKYARSLGLMADLRIVFRTISVVLRATGK